MNAKGTITAESVEGIAKGIGNYALHLGISELQAEILEHFLSLALHFKAGFPLDPKDADEAKVWLEVWSNGRKIQNTDSSD